MASKFTTVEEYINSLPGEVHDIFQSLRDTIKEVIPDGQEVISYGIPAIAKDGKCIIYYSAWKSHTSLYPFTAEMVKEFPESADYNTSGKGTIQFPYDKPLPLPLIRKITKYKLQKAIK